MKKVSRRAFARNAVVAATAAAVSPALVGQTVPAPSAEAEARIQSIFVRHGARLTDEQKADIRRLVTGGQAGLDAMRAYPLPNDVEPALPFRIFRKGSK